VRRRPPRPALVAAAALALALAAAGCGARASQPAPAPPASTAAGTAPAAQAAGAAEPTLPIHSYARVPPSPPTRLSIPGIGVSAPLIELGLRPDGSMQVPSGRDFDKPGWFTEGPEPGQLGPAVIAGHVDSRRGPSVFYRLRELRAGDQVLVERADGRTLRFEVESSRQYPKAALPTDDVFGPVPWPALRLITCGGAFDRAARSYTDNIVVTTRLLGT